MSIAQKTAKGGVWIGASQAVLLLISLLTTIILARLLTPDDFGTFAIANVFLSFAAIFSNAGMDLPTIQSKELNKQQITNLFWISFLTGILICLVMILAAFPISIMFGYPDLFSLISLGAFSFLLASIGIQSKALLKRNFRYRNLAIIDCVSGGLGSFAGIITAVFTKDVVALVVVPVTTMAFSSLLSCFAEPVRVSRPSQINETMPLAAIGANLTGFNLLNFFVRKGDDLIIGLIYSEHALGIYTKAYSLLLMPITQINSPLTTVAVPALSKVQGDAPRFRNTYVKLLSIVAMLSIPLVLFCFVAANEIVLLVLGNKFSESILVFRLLAPAAMVSALNVSTGWVFAATGRTDKQLWTGLAGAIVVISAIIIGSLYSIQGVALSISLAFVVVRIPQMMYCFHGSPVSFKDFFDAVSLPFLESIFAALTSLFFLVVFDFGLVGNFFMSATVFAFSYIATIFLIKSSRFTAMDLMNRVFG